MLYISSLQIVTFIIFNQFNLIKCQLYTTKNNININRSKLDAENTKVWGPGLYPDKIVLPARYFFIHAVSKNGNLFNTSLPEKYDIIIYGTSKFGNCRHYIEQLDRRDGSIIVRYKLLDKCKNFQIYIRYQNEHIAKSPYRIENVVYSEECSCPRKLKQWLTDMECKLTESQIQSDLNPYQKSSLNFTNIRKRILEKYNIPRSISLCNYAIKNNEIYRKCYGQYTGFKMFMDALLISVVRKVQLPDIEFFINLGDWPLVKKGGQSRTTGPIPIFSWCGSDDTFDIVLPTYDLTESTLENMGRITLDMLSVQNVDKLWNEKINKAFWRGRDSCRQRLELINLGRKHPDLFNVSLTNFFFFRDLETTYGPKVPHISFMNFFDYKYQINIDGTVAAYRLPYLLGGNSLVFKQESPFYEHFYKQLNPNKHYIPFKRDLSDLVDKIKWAQEPQNKEAILGMIRASHAFIDQHLLPKEIYCYHVLLFKEWSTKLMLNNNIRIESDMEHVISKGNSCDCPESHYVKDEL